MDSVKLVTQKIVSRNEKKSRRRLRLLDENAIV